MTPDTVHRIAQEIRYLRGALAAEEKWTLRQGMSDTRQELLARIYFWRTVLRKAERLLSR